MKKTGLLFLFLVIPLLFGCHSNEETAPKDAFIKEAKYSFKEGKAIISFNSQNFAHFNLYEKGINESGYELVDKIDYSYFETTSYSSSFKVVGLDKADKESEVYLEIPSYFDGVFSNQNIKIFSDQQNHNEINNYIDTNYKKLRADEWSNKRMEMLFLPGNYEDVTLSLGYYMSARGLGSSPDDVSFKNLIVRDHPQTENALINFWRSLENLSFNSDSTWAVSQATAIRRSHFKGNINLYYSGSASGGFIANSKIDGIANPGSQQQFLMRNDEINSWTHSNFNMVFEGCLGSIPPENPDEANTTIIDLSYDVMEKPYLIFDDSKGLGFINVKRKSGIGYVWNNEDDEFISIHDFAIFHPDDTADTINEALKTHRYALFTPGIYNLEKTIEVTLDNSLITGLGYATLSANSDMDKLMSIKSKHNKISSLLFQCEASINNFLVLEQNNEISDYSLLSDLFFRVGGQANKDTSVVCCLIVNQDKVIGDNFWVWRADHGVNERAFIGYEKNYAKNGVIINGNDVTCHALMVEHFFEYQTLWNGERGKVVFYQSETPYDPIDQTYWMRDEEGLNDEEKNGYPSYKIDDSVINHEAYGIGIYFVNTTENTLYCYSAMEAPNNEEIYLKHLVSLNFSHNGEIVNTINDIQGEEIELGHFVVLFDKNSH